MNNVKVIGEFFIMNGQVLPIDKLKEPEKIQKHLYEVIRVIGGKPLFWEEHYLRLTNSVQLSGVNFDYLPSLFHEQLFRLVKLNHVTEGNIQIDLFQLEKENVIWIYFIPHQYPTKQDYIAGVSVGLLHGERKNPHAKAVHVQLRDNANQMITGNKLYEVLLIDEKGLVTEGSRSNVFFIQDDCFYTPKASLVLLGVTRKEVIVCIAKLGFSCQETDIESKSLSQFDAAFLTGTSPKVLPISQIGNISYDPGYSQLLKLQIAFDLRISEYLRSS